MRFCFIVLAALTGTASADMAPEDPYTDVEPTPLKAEVQVDATSGVGPVVAMPAATVNGVPVEGAASAGVPASVAKVESAPIASTTSDPVAQFDDAAEWYEQQEVQIGGGAGGGLLVLGLLIRSRRAARRRRLAQLDRRTQFGMSAVDPTLAKVNIAAWEHGPAVMPTAIEPEMMTRRAPSAPFVQSELERQFVRASSPVIADRASAPVVEHRAPSAPAVQQLGRAPSAPIAHAAPVAQQFGRAPSAPIVQQSAPSAPVQQQFAPSAPVAQQFGRAPSAPIVQPVAQQLAPSAPAQQLAAPVAQQFAPSSPIQAPASQPYRHYSDADRAAYGMPSSQPAIVPTSAAAPISPITPSAVVRKSEPKMVMMPHLKAALPGLPAAHVPLSPLPIAVAHTPSNTAPRPASSTHSPSGRPARGSWHPTVMPWDQSQQAQAPAVVQGSQPAQAFAMQQGSQSPHHSAGPQPAQPFAMERGSQSPHGFAPQGPQPFTASQLAPQHAPIAVAPQAFAPEQSFAPQQAQSFAPQQAQSFAPQQAQSFAPQQAQSFAPQQAQSFAPQQAQSFAPQQAQPFAPHVAAGPEAPASFHPWHAPNQPAAAVQPYIPAPAHHARAMQPFSTSAAAPMPNPRLARLADGTPHPPFAPQPFTALPAPLPPAPTTNTAQAMMPNALPPVAPRTPMMPNALPPVAPRAPMMPNALPPGAALSKPAHLARTQVASFVLESSSAALPAEPATYPLTFPAFPEAAGATMLAPIEPSGLNYWGNAPTSTEHEVQDDQIVFARGSQPVDQLDPVRVVLPLAPNDETRIEISPADKRTFELQRRR